MNKSVGTLKEEGVRFAMYTVSDIALQKVLLFLLCFIGVSARLK